METKKPKIIGFDARFYGPIGKGLGRYSKELVDRIVSLDQVNNYVVFLRKNNFHEFKTPNPRVKKVLADVRWYSFLEQILMPYYVRKEKIDLMHWPHFNVPFFSSAKFITTIHDLILTKFPTQRATTLNPLFYKIKNRVYKIIIKKAVEKAAKIITVSEFTKKDLIKQFKVAEERIIPIYEGVADKLKIEKALADDKKIILGYNINNQYLLYVGNAYPHKNLNRLLQVFAKIKKKIPDLDLVLVGKEDYFYTQVKKYSHKIKTKAIFPGYVPDSDLSALYQNALAYVFPSKYEGFGLPPLEAMANGCPVASSNKASMPEILGQAAVYFDPDNQDDMEKKITEIIINHDLRQDLRQNGFRQAEKYSWQKCAEETLKIYEKVLAKM